MPRRWLAVSMNPPVPGVDASRYVSGETHRALPEVSITCCSETWASLSFCGSTCTCNCLARSPQMETLATPGTPSRRGMIVQRASTDIWMGVSVFDVTPTISALFVDESGCRICGGFETFGSACACVMRSATTCRAVNRSVPGSKTRKIRDMPGTDCERMSLRNAMPLSRSCSIGTVISCSTSADDNPSASVCTSTVTGAYSGRTSTGIERSSETPTMSVSAPSATTSSRNFMLQATIQLVIAGARFGAVETDGGRQALVQGLTLCFPAAFAGTFSPSHVSHSPSESSSLPSESLWWRYVALRANRSQRFAARPCQKPPIDCGSLQMSQGISTPLPRA